MLSWFSTAQQQAPPTNILVIGPEGAGKTTFISAFARRASPMAQHVPLPGAEHVDASIALLNPKLQIVSWNVPAVGSGVPPSEVVGQVMGDKKVSGVVFLMDGTSDPASISAASESLKTTIAALQDQNQRSSSSAYRRTSSTSTPIPLVVAFNKMEHENAMTDDQINAAKTQISHATTAAEFSKCSAILATSNYESSGITEIFTRLEGLMTAAEQQRKNSVGGIRNTSFRRAQPVGVPRQP